jgi:hypothetical protein
MSNLKDLQVGDKVFVVRQKGRRAVGEQTSFETITKIGRKYGYIKSGSFSLDNGQSVHNESYVRINGYGFDVFSTEAEYRQQEIEQEKRRNLGERLSSLLDNGMSARLKNIPLDVVDALLKVMDDFGIGEK